MVGKRERDDEDTNEPTRSYASITWGFSSSSYPTCSIRGPLTDQKALLPDSCKNLATISLDLHWDLCKP